MARGGVRPGAGRKQLSGTYKEETKPVRLPLSMIPAVKSFLKSALRAKNHDGTIEGLYSSTFPSDFKSQRYSLPLYESAVSAGVPSPADDSIETALDLNEHLIKHPATTFFVRVTGDSMINAGIDDRDVLIVDRSLKVKQNDIVIAVLDGELTVKRLKMESDVVYLMPENSNYSPIKVTESMSFTIWGVVTTVIRAVR